MYLQTHGGREGFSPECPEEDRNVMVKHMHRVHKKFRKKINKVSKECMDTKRRKVKNIDNFMHQKSLNL